MIRTVTMDVLLKLGMPARIKGMTYICDAIEILDTDPYYKDGKICTLYSKIASKHHTTASSVERAIRHAFETTLVKGDKELLSQYLDLTNKQNSNLLRTLYYRIKQEESTSQKDTGCNIKNCLLNCLDEKNISLFCDELAKALVRQLKTL